MAYNNARTMIPGTFGYSDLMQLGHAHECKEDKENVLLRNIAKLGYMLPIELKRFPIFDQDRNHTCVPVRGLAEYIANTCPERLLGGYNLESLSGFQLLLQKFWAAYRVVNGEHPVFEQKRDLLKNCVPIKVHTDEGTGLRKSAIYQYSWGPVIPKNMSTINRYFYWACIFHEQYRHHHSGYEIGNIVLDDLMGEMAKQIIDLYNNGIKIGGQQFFLVLTGLEGDLPAQARVCHCTLIAKKGFFSKVSRLLFFEDCELWMVKTGFSDYNACFLNA